MLVLTDKKRAINPSSGKEESCYKLLDTDLGIDSEKWVWNKDIPRGVFVLGGNGFSGYEIVINPSTDIILVLDYNESNSNYLVSVSGGTDNKISGNYLLDESSLSSLVSCGLFNIRRFNHKFYDYSDSLFSLLKSKIKDINPIMTARGSELINTNKGKLLSAKMKITGYYEEGWSEGIIPICECCIEGCARAYKTMVRYSLNLMSFRLKMYDCKYSAFNGGILTRYDLRDAFVSNDFKFTAYREELYPKVESIINNLLSEEGLTDVLDINIIGSRLEFVYRVEYLLRNSTPY